MKNDSYITLGEGIELIIDNRGKTPLKLGGDWTNAGFRVVSAKNVHDGKLDNIESIRYVSFEIYKKWMKNEIKKNDILIASEGASIGESMLWDSDEKVVIGQRLFCIRCNPLVLNPYYVAMYMQTPHYRKEYEGYSTGTSVLGISQPSLLKTRIKYLPINKQNFIANIYKLILKKIENNNKINANLEAQAAALFKSWFVDFEPFRDGEFVESELGMIPKGWKVGIAYDIVNIIYGAPYKSTLFNQDKNGLPLIRIRDLKDCSPQFYTPEILPKTEYVEYGDIVAGMDAEFTPYIWRGEKGLLNQRVLKIVPKYDGISRLFGYYLLKPELEFVQSYKVGTTVSHLGKADIDRFQVLIPPIEQIHSFSQIVDSMLERQIALDKENIRLSSLRDTLLPKLMSGEIDLDNISI